MKKYKRKKSIRTKITILICLAALIFFAIGIILWYVRGLNLLRNTTGENHREMARLMASSIVEILDKELELIKVNADDGVLREAVNESNLKYRNMDEKSARRYLLDADKKYIEAPDDHPLTKEYLENTAASRLRFFVKEEEKITGIFITDRHGGLVASSGRISAFHHADKTWWQKAFDGGTGKVTLGDIVFDERVRVWALPFVVPMRDESGEVIGIYNAFVEISIFFKTLEDFKIGKTGTAALVDDKSYLVFHRGTSPFSNKFCGYDMLERVLESKAKWLLVDGVYLRQGKVIVDFAKVNSPLLSDNNINWQVFVVQNAKEVFTPLNTFILRMLIIGSGLIILLIFTGLVLGGLFIKPIEGLREGMERLGMGDLDYRVEAQSGDEIGQLTDAFNEMAEGMKETTTPLANLDKEIAERKKVEEKIKQLGSDFASAVPELRDAFSGARDSIDSLIALTQGKLDEKQSREIDASKGKIDRSIRITDSLLDIAGMEAGRTDLNIRAVDIKALLKKLIFDLEAKIRQKGLDLKLDIPKKDIIVNLDEDKIIHVFKILIENAINFTEKGYVGISVKELKSAVEYSVTDTGIGIPTEDMPKVFEKLEHFSRSPALTEQGTGFELYIAKELVKLHNGDIWVESEAGKKTVFTFSIPKSKKG